MDEHDGFGRLALQNQKLGLALADVIDALPAMRMVWRVLYALAQDVGRCLRQSELTAQGVQIAVKDKDLAYRQYQTPLPYPTQSPLELAQTGFALFRQSYDWEKPIRALTIRAINLVYEYQPVQLYLFDNVQRRDRRKALDNCIGDIRHRFGTKAICAASLLRDLKMAQDRYETVVMPGMMYQ